MSIIFLTAKPFKCDATEGWTYYSDSNKCYKYLKAESDWNYARHV